MSNINKHGIKKTGTLTAIIAGTMLAVTGATLPASAFEGHTHTLNIAESGFNSPISQQQNTTLFVMMKAFTYLSGFIVTTLICSVLNSKVLAISPTQYSNPEQLRKHSHTPAYYCNPIKYYCYPTPAEDDGNPPPPSRLY